jgi:eukaryotic-like serine/threonine-protein kinase
MSPDRWSEVENLYHAVLERGPVERVAILNQCPDEEVQREVQSLLDHEQEGEELLEHPRWKLNLGRAMDSPSIPFISAGTSLGPYEILECIGAGGMGEVYRARDTKLGRNVALKVLPEEFYHDLARMVRFQREARILASLNHPNIAAIYSLEESYGFCALVMELIEGPTLAGRIGKRAIPEEEAVRIARQMVEGLEYAHGKGIIHRDLKPSNVKLTSEGSVKLLDFRAGESV